MMIISLGYGIKSGENGVPNVKIFFLEIGGLFILNFIGSIITYSIRQHKIEGGLLSSSIIGIIAVIIHIFSQFTGVFNKKKLH
jgi:hypothetical protein